MSETVASLVQMAEPYGRRVPYGSAYWLILPATLFLAACYYYPLIRVVWISFSEPTIGIQNYEQLITSASIHRVVTTTLRICVLCTSACVVLGYIVSYVLLRAGPTKRRVMLLCVLLPLWISGLVRAFAWVTLLRNEGFINSTLMWVGLISRPLDLVWNEVGVVIGMTHYMLPFAILPLYASMLEIDQRILMAAQSLGASKSQVFLRIFFPLSVPGVAAAGVLVFVYSIGFFITPAILGGGKTLMIAEYVRLQIVELLRWGIGTMLSVTVGVSVLIIWGIAVKLIGTQRMFGRASL
ncbi:ABC transporter permease [Bradyrhizobium sp. AZCC 2230]|uniref:ABC transporter permease n=1 Tax=Bradyrhizobium sp. AZCC 2230 TaxID=3117021 RepID=UPI002FF31B7B